MSKSEQLSYSFFLTHLVENQRLHLLGVGFLVIVFLLQHGWAWPGGVVWLSAAALLGILPFSFLYRYIQKASWPVHRQYRVALRAALLQAYLNILLITLFIHYTGGYSSPLALLYLLQLGAISFFLSSQHLLWLNLWAITLYTGLMQAYIQGWLSPAYLPLQAENLLGRELAPLIWTIYLVAIVLNWLMISAHARLVQASWSAVDAQNRYLGRLHSLTRMGLEHAELQNLYETLASEIRKIMGADAIYLTRWDEDSKQVHPSAESHKTGRAPISRSPISKHENSLTLSVLRAGKHLIVRDVNCSPYLTPAVAQRFGEKSILALPLYGLPEHRFLGALLIGYTETHDFDNEELERARQLADLAALLISRARLFHETQYRARLLEQMAGQITLLTSDLRRTTLLPSIVESARRLLKAQRAALHLYDPQSGNMKCEYSVGLSAAYLQTMNEKFDISPEAEIFHEQQFVLFPDVLRDERTNTLRNIIVQEGFRAYAVFALQSPQGRLGTLSLYWDEPHAISSIDVAVGQLFARRAGAMLQSANLYEQVAEQSLTDALTGLPNRRFFDLRLTEECKRSREYGHPFALLMIDLDGFKVINDSFGHAIGDSVIRQVASVLSRVIRSSDMVARFGGDEFALILPDVTGESAIRVAEKLKMTLAATKLHLPHDTQRYVSASIGIAICPSDASTPQSLFELADLRMYRAKRQQPGTIIFSEN